MDNAKASTWYIAAQELPNRRTNIKMAVYVTWIPSGIPYRYMLKTMKFSVPVLAPRQPNLVTNHKSNNTNTHPRNCDEIGNIFVSTNW